MDLFLKSVVGCRQILWGKIIGKGLIAVAVEKLGLSQLSPFLPEKR
ncbi:MAG: hypothetical protein U0586_05590 [Candidatus Brocadiaceae bacterium]